MTSYVIKAHSYKLAKMCTGKKKMNKQKKQKQQQQEQEKICATQVLTIRSLRLNYDGTLKNQAIYIWVFRELWRTVYGTLKAGDLKRNIPDPAQR